MQYGIGNLAQRPEFGLGDFISDVFKPVRKVVNKVVPRELQPILPVIAGAFLGPMAGSLFSGLGAGAGLAGFLGAGTSSALTQALTGSGQIDPTSTLLSAGIGGIQGARIPKGFQDTTAATMPGQGGTSLMPGQGPNVGRTVFAQPGTEAYKAAMDQAGFFDKALMTAKEYTGSTSLDPRTGRIQYDRGPDSFLKGATAFSAPYTAKAAAEEAIDLEEQERQGQIESAAQRRKDKEIYIDYVMRAGFTREEAERMADGAGYEEGGEVTKEKRMTANTGEFAGLETLMQINDATGFPQIRPAIETEEYPETSKNVDSQRKETLGENYVSGKDVMEIDSYLSETFSEEEANEYRKQIVKYQDQGKGSNPFFDAILGMGFNEGGQVPGLPRGKQVDAREGMFIPMGGAKRADDVPAMLSVNEFVLNDNAVAGLGQLMTGSPDPRAGARALYKIQDQLEAMVV